MSQIAEKTQTEIKTGKYIGRLVQKRESVMFMVLLLIFVVMSIIKSDTFFTVENIFNITKQISIITIIAVGQTFVMMTGGIDLSVGYSLSLSGIMMAKFMSMGVNPALAILIGIMTSVIIGFLNGFFHTTLKLPPFIVTLGLANIARGFTYIVTKGFPISTDSQFVLDLGNGYVGPIPIMTIVMIAVVVIATYMLRKNTFGLRVLSIGGNETAALLSGINVKRYKIIVYTIAGALCGIAGIIMAGRLNGGNPNAGLGTDMDTIAASIVGGTSLSGGEGTVIGTLFGALLLGVIKNSLVLLNVNMYWQTVVVGAVIIAVCALDHFAQSKQHN